MTDYTRLEELECDEHRELVPQKSTVFGLS